jgi:hypothetical protein
VAVSLDAMQYQSMLALNSRLHTFQLRAPHMHQRPQVPPLEAPAVWWRYAIACVRSRRQKRWPTVGAIMRRRQLQKRYTVLFRKVQKVPWLSKSKGERLQPGEEEEFRLLNEETPLPQPPPLPCNHPFLTHWRSTTTSSPSGTYSSFDLSPS